LGLSAHAIWHRNRGGKIGRGHDLGHGVEALKPISPKRLDEHQPCFRHAGMLHSRIATRK
jgi:hypothetical protein